MMLRRMRGVFLTVLSLVLGLGYSLNMGTSEPLTRRHLVRGIFGVGTAALVATGTSAALASGAGPEEAAR
jgi:hypothetical protein